MHYFYHFFFFNVSATTEIYTLSLHDALPISTIFGKRLSVAKFTPLEAFSTSRNVCSSRPAFFAATITSAVAERLTALSKLDRKSTRLNSSHGYISYAVFCLKKKT